MHSEGVMRIIGQIRNKKFLTLLKYIFFNTNADKKYQFVKMCSSLFTIASFVFFFHCCFIVDFTVTLSCIFFNLCFTPAQKQNLIELYSKFQPFSRFRRASLDGSKPTQYFFEAFFKARCIRFGNFLFKKFQRSKCRVHVFRSF